MARNDQIPLPEFDPITEASESDLGKKFRQFHRINPWVYKELRRLSLEMVKRGHKHYGIAGLFEVLRWQRAMSTSMQDGFKLNNNHKSFYSRMLMSNESTLEGFFRLRASEADNE